MVRSRRTVSHGGLGRVHGLDALDVPRAEPDDPLARLQRERDLRQRPVPAADRDHRVRGAHHERVARLAQAGGASRRPRTRSRPRGRVPGRIPTVRRAGLLRAAAGGLHHAAEPAADEHRASATQLTADLLGGGQIAALARADYRDVGQGRGGLVANRRRLVGAGRRRGRRRRGGGAGCAAPRRSRSAPSRGSRPPTISAAPASPSQAPVSGSRSIPIGGWLTSWLAPRSRARGSRPRAACPAAAACAAGRAPPRASASVARASPPAAGRGTRSC